MSKDCVRPKKGKMTRGGTSVKHTIAVLQGRILVCKPCSKYITSSADSVPKPKAPKLSKNGKRLGRRPKPNNNKKVKKRGYDGWAHAAFLADVAGEARAQLGLGPLAPLDLVQDGVPLHWSPPAQKVLDEKGFHPTESHPGYSPDLNPIENAFGGAERELSKLLANRPAKNVGRP